MARKGLGSGMNALFADAPVIEERVSSEKVVKLSVNDVSGNPNQPRKNFDNGKLKELAASIKEQGVLQPILVRPVGGGKYEIIAGERRFRAAKMAELTTIPAIVRAMDDDVTLELALIENVQREDLNPLEEAQTYRDLMDNYAYTQAKIADKIGKSRVYVANIVRLLGLPEPVKNAIGNGRLTAGHGRALLMLEDDVDQQLLTVRIIDEGLSVRQTEMLAKNPKEICKNLAKDLMDLEKVETAVIVNREPIENFVLKDLVLEEVGDRLRNKLQTKVTVMKTSDRAGRIILEYYNDDDLQRIIDELLPGEEF